MSDDYTADEVADVKTAIDGEDYERVKELLAANPSLHHAPLGYNQNGALTLVAECRGKPPTAERLELAQWLIDHGSDVHQGGDGPLMRASLFDERIPMMDLLVRNGADVNAMWDGHYPILCAPCETLQPAALAWLLDHGADPNRDSSDYAFADCVKMVVSTYSRNAGKHECLEILAERGAPLPDTAPMAIHRGRVDLLAACVARNAAVIGKRFPESEVFPAELGIKPKDGLHCAPLDGGTLLHMAVEFQELELSRWLVRQGADVNARAAIDDEGFGGHTPLYHTTVTLSLGARDDSLASLLLENGADPSVRATFRKQLQYMGEPEKEQMREYQDVTAIEFARQFQEPAWVNEAAIRAIEQHRPDH